MKTKKTNRFCSQCKNHFGALLSLSAFKPMLFLLVFFSSLLTHAQVDPGSQFKNKVFPPSPEAANLGRYGEYPVTLNNGLVNISVPIYEIKSGDLSLPISLSYHAGGVKVYDISSSVGLGWTLNAGGAITRVVLGRPDEGGAGSLNNPFPSPDDPGDDFQCFIGLMADPQFTRDGQHDLYYYTMGNTSGKFMFKNVLTTIAPREAVTIPYSTTKISLTPATSEFTMVDEAGTTYTYGATETSSVFGMQGAVYSNATTTWYLTSIVSADKTDVITFNYTAPIVVITTTESTSLTERRSGNTTDRLSESRSADVTTHLSRNVSEIIFNNGKVMFDYLTDRLDTEGKRLSGIRIFSKDPGSLVYEKIREFTPSQTYFESSVGQSSQVTGSGSTENHYVKRLRLDAMTEVGFRAGVQEAKPPFRFDYDTGPFPRYATTAQDFMGYYNGAHNNENIRLMNQGTDENGFTIVSEAFGSNREVNPAFVKAGSLQKITYPTGGSTTFEMEPNQLTAVQNTPNYTNHSYMLTSRDPAVTERVFTPTQAMMGNALSIEANLDIDLVNYNQTQPVIQTTIELFDITANATVPLSQSSGTASWNIGSSTTSMVQRETVVLIAGHTYRLFYLGSFPFTSNAFYVTLSWKYISGYTAATVTNYTGGLRIKSITNNDGQNNVLKKTYVYTKAYYNSNLFSGSISSLSMFYISRFKDWYYPEPNPPPYHRSPEESYFVSYGENVTFQLGSVSGLTASYEEVEEYQTDGQGNSIGKVVSTFNVAVDGIPSLAPFFRSDWEWKRGQLANRKVYKSTPGGYVLLKEETNLYDYELMGQIKGYDSKLTRNGYRPYDPLCPLCGNQMIPGCNAVPKASEFNWMDFEQPIYKSNLISSATIDYDEAGLNPLSSETQYVYDNTRHFQLLKTINSTSQSEERKLITSFKYPLDYTIGTCDPLACYNNYHAQVNDFLSLKDGCERQYSADYSFYQASAAAILAPIEARRVSCESSCTFDPTICLCESNYLDEVAHSQYDETIASANAAFINYKGCAALYNLDLLVYQLNSCIATYTECVSAVLGGSTPTKDKSIVIMQRDNVINRVVEKTAGFSLNGTEYVASGQLTDFKPFANGTAGPDLIWGFTSSTPVTKASFDLNPALYYRKIGTFSRYNSSNNVIQQSKENDISTSYLWDYNQEYPVAEVVNASVDDIAYSSFETSDLGNFGSIGGTARNTADFRTGTQSYDLSSGTITKGGLVLNKDYIISFWAKAGVSVSINNGPALVPASPISINGWQYYETTVKGTSIVTSAVISGTGLIDELRFYPVGSQMTTYTYDPLIGITSQTDANNMTTYYEYDSHGRLKLIRDSNQNILKNMVYHYKGE